MEPQIVSVVMTSGGDPDLLRKKVASRLPQCVVQTVRADTASNGFFVEMIAAQTLRAYETNSLLARKPELDLLLRLAGTTQISKAIGQVGSKKGDPFLLVVGGPGDSLRRFHWEELGGSLLEKRRLSDSELDRIEVAALLNVEKA